MVATTEQDILGILSEVFDPEVPVLNIVEMGIVRRVEVGADDSVRVFIVPTYTGCPAMNAIEVLVRKALNDAGLQDAVVTTLFHEAWSTSWMTDEAREKLREYGIAPPDDKGDPEAPVPCPFCGSDNTRMQSYFGSTACKSMHFCDACVQPFEHFKCH